MLRFIVRRLLLLVPILLGLSVLLFAWVRALPGGPAQALLGERATPEAVAAIESQLGLDRPLWEQYLQFLGRAVRLDFGASLQTGQPVIDEMVRRFPATIELALAALLIAVAVGIPLGYLAARRYGTWIDSLAVTGSLLGVTIPIFFLAYILKYVFSVELGWLPTAGRADARARAEHPTGFYVLDGIVTGNLDASWDAIQHLILPALALASIPLAVIVRITRASVLNVVNEDYVRTAEAKGLLPGTITRRHVLKNAMLPVTTVIGLQLGVLLAGAVLTETVFAFAGVGKFMADAIVQRDFPTIQGFILVIAVVYVVINMIVDLVYGLLDPRVRVS
ncbi:ABC transporter permease [Jiangella sp. DSM 45060]|uniref:ABC transporter permease n=1 Tax=Jiangella sp. DSM 45060 TaxID=1798224 RepID=UPI00087D9115|nr:ABC transporter permease [Jiangella sp. DSM 45060]SDS21370.1 peptide/nickel transport system permease protein [Jiangella sp. DSM 45060]